MKKACLVIAAILWGTFSSFAWWPFDDPLKKERLETELHPDSWSAWYSMARAAYRQEMWAEVETSAKKIIQLGENKQGYHYLGLFYEHKGDNEMALMCFKRAKDLDKIDETYRRMGNPSGVKEFYSAEIKVSKRRISGISWRLLRPCGNAR
jgi:tetratricopeptide (TPR) repeat protein